MTALPASTPSTLPSHPVHEADVAIIGAGPSGLFMVFEAGFLGYRCVVLDALPQVGGQLAALYPDKPIYDIPGHPMVLAGALVEQLAMQAAPYQPTYLLGEPVQHLEEADGVFTLNTASQTVRARCVIIAGGGGMFVPRKPNVPGLDTYEASGAVTYAIPNLAAMTGRHVVVAGGGDSAVDWVVALAKVAASVQLVHRRADFKAAPATVAQMKALEAEGKVILHTPYQLQAVEGDGAALTGLVLADLDGATRTIEADRLVCCFGIAPNAGPLAEWGLDWEKGQIPVDRGTMQTRRAGILCIGDMAGYEGKISLILTGFAEAAVAAKQVQARLDPAKKYKVQYSTSKGVPGTPGTPA